MRTRIHHPRLFTQKFLSTDGLCKQKCPWTQRDQPIRTHAIRHTHRNTHKHTHTHTRTHTYTHTSANIHQTAHTCAQVPARQPYNIQDSYVQKLLTVCLNDDIQPNLNRNADLHARTYKFIKLNASSCRFQSHTNAAYNKTYTRRSPNNQNIAIITAWRQQHHQEPPDHQLSIADW